MECQMAKWLVAQLASNSQVSKECPRYNMTIISRHMANHDDKCSPQGLASRIFELKISDQVVPFNTQAIKVGNYWHQIDKLITHSVTLKKHVEVFIYWKRE